MPIIPHDPHGAPTLVQDGVEIGQDSVQDLTLSGSSIGGVFRLGHDGYWTRELDATSPNLDTDVIDALRELPHLRTSGIEHLGGTIGTGLRVRFSTHMGRRPVALIMVDISKLTGQDTTLDVVESQQGVYPTGVGQPKGSIAVSTDGFLFINTGTGEAPVWSTICTIEGFGMSNGADIAFRTGTGSRIGRGPAEKFAFWGATPRSQPHAVPVVTEAPSSGPDEQLLRDLKTAVNRIISRLEDVGLVASN